MSSPWKKVDSPVTTQNLSEIMSEEYAKLARSRQDKKEIKIADHKDQLTSTSSDKIMQSVTEDLKDCDSDAIIAKLLQCQFDKERENEAKKVEKRKQGSKISVTYDSCKHVSEQPTHSESEEEAVGDSYPLDKDEIKFANLTKCYSHLGRRAFALRNGALITKIDGMISTKSPSGDPAIPLEVWSGDITNLDRELPDSIYSYLKEQTRRDQERKPKSLDTKDMQDIFEMDIDEPTRLILYKLINRKVLENIDGIIFSGPESFILHGNGNVACTDYAVPRECTIKVFMTVLEEFNPDFKIYKYKHKHKQNVIKVGYVWAEKEAQNLKQLKKIGINCPDVICLKKHVLVMSFIGSYNLPAQKLRDVMLKAEKWPSIYAEVVDAMYKMYNEGHLIHANLTCNSILWWEDKCWFIDVSESIRPDYRRALKILARDCHNICFFFKNKCVPNVKTPDELFKYITGFEDFNMKLINKVNVSFNSTSNRFEISSPGQQKSD